MAAVRKARQPAKKKKPARRKQDPHRARLIKIAASIGGRGRFMSTLEEFSSVPLDHPGLTRAFQLKGAPVGCVWVVHGPTHGGKTAFTARLIRNFQQAGAVTAFIDAEMIADRNWFELMGVNLNELIYVGRTDKSKKQKRRGLTYEETVDGVESVMRSYQEERGKKPPLLIVVDSINRLVPEGFVNALEKDGGKALRKSAVGRESALLSSAWIMGVGPRVCDDDIALVLIAHEGDNKGGKPWEKNWYVKGGGELLFEAGVQVRVAFAGRSQDVKDGDTTGKRHRVTVLKNKLGRSDEQAYLFTGNGVGKAPLGFDEPRELVTEALHQKLLKAPASLMMGSVIKYGRREIKLADLYGKNAEKLLGEIRQLFDD